MSLINKNNLNYLYCVEQYFLSLIKTGIALSPLDYEVIKTWEKTGVPLSIACAGIKKGIESFRKTHGSYKPLPRSIRYSVSLVEKEFTNYRRLKVGAHSNQNGEIAEKKILLRKIDVLAERIAEARNTEKDEKLKKLYAVVCDRILDLRSNIERNYLSLYAQVEKIDKFFLNEFCKLLSPDELANLMTETEKELSRQKVMMSREAYRATLTNARNLLVRKKYGLLQVRLGD